MEKKCASILLIIFVGFLVSISTNFSLYVKVLNGGSMVEDVNPIPEEQHEKNISDPKLKTMTAGELQFSASICETEAYYHLHRFSLVENIYFDVPYPPPELV